MHFLFVYVADYFVNIGLVNRRKRKTLNINMLDFIH